MNRLNKEQSPYLLQHAHQPVFWYPWCLDAFKQAKSQDKPIFLSIGYATCHWCHVMAHESFDDPEIAQVLNEHFIAIKLDREERPDIDHIYMSAVSALTGSGGWPLNVFLNHEGHPFYGGTYFPPTPRWGQMGFKELLLSISQAWQNNRQDILQSGEQMVRYLKERQNDRFGIAQAEDFPQMLRRAYEHWQRDYDVQHGGFGQMPKFPMPHVLTFLSRYAVYANEPQAKDIVEKTLIQMACSGLWDHVGGGFHRYSVDERWHVPHFEKMLYDQAGLLRAYAEGYQMTGQWLFAQRAHAIIQYLEEEMTHSEGAFYTAQDADSLDEAGHAREGAYYVFTAKEIDMVLGEEATWVKEHLGVEEQGNVRQDPHGEFINQNVLYRLRLEFDQEERLQQALLRLKHYRAQRPKPITDDKILVDLNGSMIAALAFAGRVFDQQRVIDLAQKAADFIWQRCWDGEMLYHRWRQNEKAFVGTLDDYVNYAYGCLQLYEATFMHDYLQRSVLLVEKIKSCFGDGQGGYFMTQQQDDILIVRPRELYDGATASGLSVLALLYVRLAALLGEDQYKEDFEQMIKYHAAYLEGRPSALLGLWSAWMHADRGGIEVLLHGTRTHSEIAKMMKILYKDFRPFMVTRFTSGQGDVCAYVCRQRVCHQPVKEAEQLLPLLS